jgi:hypothetical protein
MYAEVREAEIGMLRWVGEKKVLANRSHRGVGFVSAICWQWHHVILSTKTMEYYKASGQF